MVPIECAFFPFKITTAFLEIELEVAVRSSYTLVFGFLLQKLVRVPRILAT